MRASARAQQWRGEDVAPSVSTHRHAPREPRRDIAQVCDLARLERHHRGVPAVAGQHIGGAGGKPPVARARAFQLDEHRRSAGHEVAQFTKRDHAVRGSLELDALELGGCHCIQSAGSFGEPAQRVVVVHHRLAIAADLQIAFDPIISGDGGGECRHRVLDDALCIIV